MTDYFHRGSYRPTPEPAIETPLGARSIGHYRVRRDFREAPMEKHFLQVFWGISGSGILLMDGEEKRLDPGHIALYLPGMTHNLYPLSEAWEYRWWTMDGPLALPIAAAYGLAQAGVYPACPAPEPLFIELEEAIRKLTAEGEHRASALAIALLAHAAAHRNRAPKDDWTRKAIALIHEEWMRPELNVESLSKRLGLDRSVFSRRFRASTGVPPVTYIGNLRVQNALSLLKHTDRTVAGVAAACGFTDPNYFARVFRESSGYSPRQFRLKG
ncbi:MAG: AraC family transcriptional regulator [Planctomycetes bacterium]|nr:AraC family transcriptional regulator [Planctomycetota bacterium]